MLRRLNTGLSYLVHGDVQIFCTAVQFTCLGSHDVHCVQSIENSGTEFNLLALTRHKTSNSETSVSRRRTLVEVVSSDGHHDGSNVGVLRHTCCVHSLAEERRIVVHVCHSNLYLGFG